MSIADFLVAQWHSIRLPRQETQVVQAQSLGHAYVLEKQTATHSSSLAGRTLWTEEPGGLQSMGSHRVEHDLATKQ